MSGPIKPEDISDKLWRKLFNRVAGATSHAARQSIADVLNECIEAGIVILKPSPEEDPVVLRRALRKSAASMCEILKIPSEHVERFTADWIERAVRELERERRR